MKLTYWVAECLDDAKCYSIRGKTRSSVSIELTQRERDGEPDIRERYSPPLKVTVEYRDGFDLLDQCHWEGGLLAEARVLLEHHTYGNLPANEVPL